MRTDELNFHRGCGLIIDQFGLGITPIRKYAESACSSDRIYVMKIYELDFLLKLLNTDQNNLNRILNRKEDLYFCFQIPKKNGMRRIYAIDIAQEDGKRLKILQKRFYQKVLIKQPVAMPAKGFLKGESYLTFLEPHVGNSYFMRLDICDFFESFSKQMIRENMGRFIEDEDAGKIAFELCTIDGKIPQGAVTSPALSNIVFARLDQRMHKYCQTIENRQRESLHRCGKSWRNVSIRYTRYADDLLFSSDFFDFRNNLSFLRMISKILGEYGFRLNRKKTMMTQSEISLSGYVTGTDIRLSGKKTKDLRRVLFFCRDKRSERYQLDKRLFADRVRLIEELNQFLKLNPKNEKRFSNIYELIWFLGGCRSWIISVLRSEENTREEVRKMKKLLLRTEWLLDELNQTISQE